ncbi:hypothetical protein STIAU_0582, partial [Stigmatella aurantiaca DW4/3-1]
MGHPGEASGAFTLGQGDGRVRRQGGAQLLGGAEGAKGPREVVPAPQHVAQGQVGHGQGGLQVHHLARGALGLREPSQPQQHHGLQVAQLGGQGEAGRGLGASS